MRFKPLPLMTAAAAAALAILILLGNWQWGRYQQKLHARAAPPARVAIADARPLPGKLQLVYALNDEGPAWRVFAPVVHDGRTTFVDTGAVKGLNPPDWRTVPEPFAGPVGLKGLAVSGRPPPMTAVKPDTARHVWYAVDLPAMARAAGAPPPTGYYLALDYVGPNGALVANPYADPRAADPLPPERHLGYALTWWGLAGALVGVYAAFHIRAGRLAFGGNA
ncbi:MAG TPA: SURF1 family protein [Caulobacterales bacterium]|nr:SURF1 family protein [Caulobacterales bacterium]